MILAHRRGFVSRADADLTRPRSRSLSITPQHGGCAVHWGGPAPEINSHADCVKTWKAWQTFHVKTRGWVDIAYTGGFCQHGYAFAGRGLGVRTAANGTNTGNQNYYAFVWIGGAGMKPSAAARRCLRWWIRQARQHGDAGRRVVEHNAFTGSSCPGPELTADADRLDRASITPMPRTLRRGDKGRAVLKLRRRLARHGYPNNLVNRHYSRHLRKQVVRFKRSKGRLGTNGAVTPRVWIALYRKPR